MVNSQKIMQMGAKIQSRINSNDKKARSFGTSQMLHQSEIHFIDAIGMGEGVNATQLSQKLGITNGAVTQLASKLLKKQLIVKYKKEHNKKEVFLRLTEEGTIAFENHILFHKELNDNLLQYLDGLSPAEQNAILGLMEVIEKYLPDLSEEEQK